MAKKQTDSVYRVVDVVGVSDKSWEDAGRRAVETAAGSLRDLARRRSHQDGHAGGERQSSGVPHPGRAVIQIRVLTRLTAAFAHWPRWRQQGGTAYCFPPLFLPPASGNIHMATTKKTAVKRTKL